MATQNRKKRTIRKTQQRVAGTVSMERRVQQQVARAGRAPPKKGFRGSMQAGARPYSAPPMPAQQRAKPGPESQIHPPPIDEARYHRVFVIIAV